MASANEHSPSRRSIFFVPFIGVLLFTLIAAAGLELVLRQWYIERTDKDMHHIMNTTLDTMRRIGTDNYEIGVSVDSIGLAIPKYRISVANTDGQIIGDSFLDEDKLTSADTLSGREEFESALRLGKASLIRFSEAMNNEVLFIAKRIHVGDFDGIIRLGLPTDEYHKAVSELRVLLAGLALCALLFMALLVGMFSRHINAAMSKEQRLLEDRIQERTRDILLLHRLTNMLAACQDLNEVQNVVEDIVPRIIGNVNCSISLVNSSRNLVEKKIDWGGEWPGESLFNPHDCWALRKGKPHFSHDELSAQACVHMGDYQDNTLCIPLMAHGNAIGLLHMALGKHQAPNMQEMTFTIAEHLGLALANLNMQEKLRQQATRDPLTGLYNRRYFEESLDKELSRSQRHHEPCALLMVDIDHFKNFNDNFGHDAGDYVLKALSLILQDTVRSEDTVCRLGGEELALLLPKANINDALTVASKVCKAISSNHFQLHNTALGTVTVSVGISVYPVHASCAESLTKNADVALYEAKHNGRNRYEVYKTNENKEHGYCLVDEPEPAQKQVVEKNVITPKIISQ